MDFTPLRCWRRSHGGVFVENPGKRLVMLQYYGVMVVAHGSASTSIIVGATSTCPHRGERPSALHLLSSADCATDTAMSLTSIRFDFFHSLLVLDKRCLRRTEFLLGSERRYTDKWILDFGD